MSDYNALYPSSFKLPLCWLHSLTSVTSLSMLPGIRSLAAAIHLEIHRIYIYLLIIIIPLHIMIHPQNLLMSLVLY